jgi:hypothetical protein
LEELREKSDSESFDDEKERIDRLGVSQLVLNQQSGLLEIQVMESFVNIENDTKILSYSIPFSEETRLLILLTPDLWSS